jgi:hypothetical protein
VPLSSDLTQSSGPERGGGLGFDKTSTKGPLRPAIRASLYLVHTQPWGALIGTGAAGVAVMAITDAFGNVLQSPKDIVAALRLAFAVVAFGIGFLGAEPAPSLVEALPTRLWALRAVRLVLALPIVVVVGWAQLSLAAGALATDERAQGLPHHPLAWPGLAMELAGFGALALLGAFLVGRSRWRDLGGVIAAPLALGAIAILVIVPFGLFPTAYLLVPSRPHEHAWVTAEWEWVTLSIAAMTSAVWASRDQWERCSVNRLTLTARVSLIGRVRDPRRGLRSS